METLALVLSFLGLICICTPSFLKGKHMGQILLLLFSANLLLAVSYLLTGAYNGAVSGFIACAQTLINYAFDRKNKPLPWWLLAVYALSFITVNAFVFTRPLDLLAIVASLSSIPCISQKNGAKYRLFAAVNIGLWLLYDGISLSFGPLITHAVQLSTVLAGMIIHDRKKRV